MSNDVPIHTCVVTLTGGAEVYKKVSLYASEHVCTIIVRRSLSPNANVQALRLATILCEALETQRETSNEAR
jgi:hypothetical protein